MSAFAGLARALALAVLVTLAAPPAHARVVVGSKAFPESWVLGEAAALLEPGVPVRQRTTPGGAGPVPVAVQRGRLAERVAAERACWNTEA